MLNVMPLDRITQKKKLLDKHQPLAPELLKNLEEWFRVELTYTSNAIEGNTLTRRETAVVIEKGLTIGNKSLTEHLEARNHAQALDLVRSLSLKRLDQFSNQDILAIHAVILNGIDDLHVGRYRTVAVRISGSAVVLPNPRKVPDLMDELQIWMTHQTTLHPVELALEAHYRLVSIHPFVDGNGRTSRLLMNCLLMMHGYPPAIIRKRDRLVYLGALEQAQLGGARDNYERIMLKSVERSLDIYLKVLQGESLMEGLDQDDLMKIGELAKVLGQTVPTVRYWTQEGLLEVAEVSSGGYQLYAPHMIERGRQIQKLKQERFTLAEIKHKLK